MVAKTIKYVSVPPKVWVRITEKIGVHQDSTINVQVAVQLDDLIELPPLPEGAKWIVGPN